jgi:hypothetical protein
MTNYVFEYDGSERPKVIKRIVDSNNTSIDTFLNFHNEADRLALTAEEVYSHIDNLVQYIKDRSQLITSVALTDPRPADGWHFGGGGWAEIEWAKDEILLWWEYAYYSNKFSEEEPEAEPEAEGPA